MSVRKGDFPTNATVKKKQQISEKSFKNSRKKKKRYIIEKKSL